VPPLSHLMRAVRPLRVLVGGVALPLRRAQRVSIVVRVLRSSPTAAARGRGVHLPLQRIWRVLPARQRMQAAVRLQPLLLRNPGDKSSTRPSNHFHPATQPPPSAQQLGTRASGAPCAQRMVCGVTAPRRRLFSQMLVYTWNVEGWTGSPEACGCDG
jgi:hypothetical protein